MTCEVSLPLEVKMELRRLFRQVPLGQKRQFLREQGERLGYNWRTIQRAILG